MTVDYIPFATGGGASVLPQATYVTEAPTGVVPGLADPTYANKAWRQSSMIASAVANFISATLGIDVLDDGNITALIANLTAALELAASSGVAVGMNAPTNLHIRSPDVQLRINREQGVRHQRPDYAWILGHSLDDRVHGGPSVL